MSILTCVEVELALPALALDALDEEERTSVLEHLGSCNNCKAKLAQYIDVTDRLLEAVPQRTPPPALKKALLGRVQPERASWRERLAEWLNGRQMLPRWSLAAGGAVFVAILTFLGVTTQRLADQQAVLATQISQQQQALAILAGDATNLVEMSGTQSAAGASAVMRYIPQEKLAVVQTHNLPVLPAGKTYQLWLIDASGKHDSGAVFNVSNSTNGTVTLVVYAPRPMSDYVSCGVSIEPMGGSVAPTGPAALKGDLWS